MPARSLLWPDPRVKPAFGSVEVDWGHPLAADMVGCFLFNEGAGVTLVNLANPSHGTFVASSEPTWGSLPTGSGLRFTSAGKKVALAAAVFNNQTLAFVTRATVASLSADRAVIGSTVDDGAEWRVDQTTGTLTLLRQQWQGLGTSSLALTVGPAYSMAVSFDAADVWRFALDGKSAGTGTTVANFNFGAGVPQIGAATAAGEYFDGAMEFFYLYNVGKSQDHLNWLTVEPYVLLRPILRRRYFVVTATVEGGWLLLQNGTDRLLLQDGSRLLLQGQPVATGNRLLLQDGSSLLLLQNGVDHVLLQAQTLVPTTTLPQLEGSRYTWRGSWRGHFREMN